MEAEKGCNVKRKTDAGNRHRHKIAAGIEITAGTE